MLSTPTKVQQNHKINESALEQNARMLETVLDAYGVHGRIVHVRPGPVVTLYELEPAPGTKTSRVVGLSDDIARSMSAGSVRIAVVPGRNAIGIELPNQDRETVYLRELLSTVEYEKSKQDVIIAKSDLAPSATLSFKDIFKSELSINFNFFPYFFFFA